ncbi:tyrosine-type recombinase/integrase [Diplocloster modestus]|uniref:Site-specific integrase n=1 Tax=Diplocloster modestus TaxID=2850322 RepID=A0ABS6KC92_9FIRM|nr:tyrosine-type recombinase/integrase [Diplocloster modestus]MBU9728134.1 site-specific integrase [Diplocloster modestus]
MMHGMDLLDLTRYLEDLHCQERSAATIEKYERALTRFYHWLPEKKQLDKDGVIDYKNELTRKFAPAGVNTSLAALNGFFRFMSWEDCIVKPLRLQRRTFASKEKELTRCEYERLVSTADRKQNSRLSLLLQTLASTGIRASEVRYITVEAARCRKAVIILKGKTRTILLPEKLCYKLLKYARDQKIDSGELFLTRHGRPLDRKEIWAQMKHLCCAAGVDPGKVFPHNLRHLFARIFYDSQKDIAKLADLMGHSSVETTRIYLLSSGEEHMQALDRLHLIC